MSSHPDLLEIDAVRGADGRPEHRAHIETCSACRAQLVELEGLAEGLRPLAAAPFEIPAEVDRRILWEAGKRALAAKRRPLWKRPAWAAAAAAVLVAGLVTLLQRGPLDHEARLETAMAPRAAAPAARVAAADDVNGDGKVDILDAFALARANGDSGAIDRLAARAVSLGGA